jgi:hypothetical protein
MSYDLAVWRQDAPYMREEIVAGYRRRAGADSHEPADPDIDAFITAVLRRLPDMDVNSNGGDDCPWSIGPLRDLGQGNFIVLSMRYDRVEDGRSGCVEAAKDVGLICYDPQTDQVLAAGGRSPRPALQVRTSGGGSFDDPSDELLLVLLQDLHRRRDYFVIDDLRDSSGETYSQVMRGTDGYLVEYRGGSEVNHHHAMIKDISTAHSDLATKLYQRGGGLRGPWVTGMASLPDLGLYP